MNLSRLSGRKICDRVMRRGSVWKGRHMWVRWLPGHPPHPAADTSKSALYVGTVASTKLEKSAVKRNRMRRRCREALRLALKDLREIPTAQLLLCPRSSSLSAPFADIQADVSLFLSHLTAWQTQAKNPASSSSL